MSIQSSGIKEPKMTCAISLAQTLERKERARGLSVPEARRALARKIKVGVGTIENLVRGRVKRADAAIRDRLEAWMVRELESEILRLTHDLEMARRSGFHLASVEVGEIEAHLAQASALLKRGT